MHAPGYRYIQLVQQQRKCPVRRGEQFVSVSRFCEEFAPRLAFAPEALATNNCLNTCVCVCVVVCVCVCVRARAQAAVVQSGLDEVATQVANVIRTLESGLDAMDGTAPHIALHRLAKFIGTDTTSDSLSDAVSGGGSGGDSGDRSAHASGHGRDDRVVVVHSDKILATTRGQSNPRVSVWTAAGTLVRGIGAMCSELSLQVRAVRSSMLLPFLRLFRVWTVFCVRASVERRKSSDFRRSVKRACFCMMMFVLVMRVRVCVCRSVTVRAQYGVRCMLCVDPPVVRPFAG